jgi:hypothetical protein
MPHSDSAYTGHVHTTAAQLDEEEDVESLHPNRVDGKEIDGQQALTVCAAKFAPRRFSALACRSETGGPEPDAYRCC